MSLFRSILGCALAAMVLGPATAASDPGLSPLPSFESSDPERDALAMDLFRRHLRIAGDPLRLDSGPPVGGGLTLWWVWNNPQYVWFSPEPRSWHVDRHAAFKGHMMTAAVDRFGYVWTAHNNPVAPTSPPMTDFGHGWAFPEYPQSHGNSTGWEWNGDSAEGWTAHQGSVTAVEGGRLSFEFSGAGGRLESPPFEADAFHAPFIYMQVAWLGVPEEGAENAHRFYIEFATEDEPEFRADKRVSSCTEATIRLTRVETGARHRLYFPMYLHPRWEGTITGLRVGFPHGSPETPFDGALEFVRLNYDSRQAVNNPIFHIAVRDYTWWTGDLDLVENRLDDLRRAMIFMLEHLKGREGLLDVGDFFVGHEGTPLDEDGEVIVGRSIGDGYMDILAVGPLALEPSIHFHNALLAMADIEDLVATRPGLRREMPRVSGPDGRGEVTYSETAASLRALVPKVRDAINETFWNEETGRYGLSADARGELKDFGYTLQNQMLVTSGIAPPERARSIMDWVDGRRTVPGDDSQGDDIYIFRFAPRFSTRENPDWYLEQWTLGKRVWTHLGFGDQIQDGGATLFTSYYDLLSRIEVYGADDAWDRWNAILDWHEDVLEHGGEGGRLYRDYYRGEAMADHPIVEDRDGSLQGGGTSGGLGLDEEFIESGLVFGAWPMGFLGVEPAGFGVLRIAPNPPSGKTMRLDHVWFHDARVNVAATGHTIDLTGTTLPEDHELTMELAFALQTDSPPGLLRDGEPVPGVTGRRDEQGRWAFRLPLQPGVFTAG